MNPSLRCRPSLERLEDRACPAFFAGLVQGNLVITATESTNLAIDQALPDSFAIYETNSGTLAFIQGVTEDVIIKLSDQDDFVSMSSSGLFTPDDVHIDLGDGSNSLNLGGFAFDGGIGGDLVILGGSGRDAVSLGDTTHFSDMYVNGYTAIFTGQGDDVLDIGRDSRVLFLRSAVIHLGSGNDSIFSRGIFHQSFLIHLGNGNDGCVNFGSFHQPSHVFGGGGSDIFFGFDNGGNVNRHGFENEFLV
jgi:hypothetical protein